LSIMSIARVLAGAAVCGRRYGLGKSAVKSQVSRQI
jgi:hypothetical protein